MAGFLVKLLGSTLISGLTVLIIVIVGTSAEGRTLFVDDDGGMDHIRIQDAIDEAKEGDEVRVYEGTYGETLRISRSVRLKGNGSSTTFIEGIEGEETITINGRQVQIEGFTIAGGSSGVMVKSGDATIMNNRIKNSVYGIIAIGARSQIIGNTIVNNQIRGIYLTHASKSLVEGNLIVENQDGINIEDSHNITLRSNILWGNLISFGDSTVEEILSTTIDDTNRVDGKPILFLKNESGVVDGRDQGQYIIVGCNELTLQSPAVDQGNIGVLVIQSANITIHNATMTSCDIGIWVLDSRSVMITDATCTLGRTGIEIQRSEDCEISGGQFTNNSKYGLSFEECSGLMVSDVESSGNAVAGLTITDSTESSIRSSIFTRNHDGMYLEENDVTHITGCRVNWNTVNGIQIGTERNVFVSGCEITYNPTGIRIQDGEWIEIRENNIEKNENYGIHMRWVSRWAIDITMNWWGTFDGPYNENENPEGAGNPIFGAMNVSPWRTSPVVLGRDTEDDYEEERNDNWKDPTYMSLLMILFTLLFMLGKIVYKVVGVSDAWDEGDL